MHTNIQIYWALPGRNKTWIGVFMYYTLNQTHKKLLEGTSIPVKHKLRSPFEASQVGQDKQTSSNIEESIQF